MMKFILSTQLIGQLAGCIFSTESSMCQDCPTGFPPRFQVSLSTKWIQNPFVYKMNLVVNCLSIKIAKPNDPLFSNDKKVWGLCVCVHKHAKLCTFVVRVWKSQTKYLAGSSVRSKWGWDMVWISCSCWEHHKELTSVEMQNTGAGKPSILFLAGIQSLPLWVLIPAVLGMVQMWDAVVFLP